MSDESPLRGITKWGGNIVKTLAEGIYDSKALADDLDDDQDAVRQAAQDLARAITGKRQP